LLEQHRADQADDRGLVGEDADDIGAAFDFLVEPLQCKRSLIPTLRRTTGMG